MAACGRVAPSLAGGCEAEVSEGRLDGGAVYVAQGQWLSRGSDCTSAAVDLAARLQEEVAAYS